MRVCLDVDGTVLDRGEAAFEAAVDRAWELVEADAFVGYVTYRSERAEEATSRALAEAGLPDGPVHGCPAIGVVDAAGAKADLLDQLDATVYVGDAPFDREAARRAGCAFLEAEDWRAGIPVEEAGPPRGSSDPD